MASTFPGSLDDFTRAPSDGVSPLNNPRLSVLVNDLEMALEAVQSALGINLGAVSKPGHTHTADNLSDASTVGKAVVTAVDASAARTAIGAGTSSLTLGTTAADATPGDHPADTTAVHGIPDTSLLLTTSSSIPASAISQTPRQPYTPAWTALTTDPVLGNGSLIGTWSQIGTEVFVSIRLVVGSTTTTGSGSYRITLPVPPKADVPLIGHGLYVDAGTGYLFCSARVSAATQISLMMASLASTGNGLLEWQSGGPVVPAAGDVLDLNLNYEAA